MVKVIKAITEANSIDSDLGTSFESSEELETYDQGYITKQIIDGREPIVIADGNALARLNNSFEQIIKLDSTNNNGVGLDLTRTALL